jgi:hypothetical protein
LIIFLSIQVLNLQADDSFGISSIDMSKESSSPDFELFVTGVWNSMLQRLQRPVEGVLLPVHVARKLGEPLLNRLLNQKGENLNQADFSAGALESATLEAKETVAEERTNSKDQERFRDPEDKRYERNLNLLYLQKSDSSGHFHHAEWDELYRFLKPFASPQFRKKNIGPEDAEEIYNTALASLTKKKKDKPNLAPIQWLIVFEEIIPNFCRLISLRSIDWHRRQSAKKARPESLVNLEAMTTEEGAQVELADRGASDPDEPATWRFEEIYRQCKELLTDTQWSLIFKLHVSQTHTVKDLVQDRKELTDLGLDPTQSPSTLRRRIDEILQPALVKLADALEI